MADRVYVLQVLETVEDREAWFDVARVTMPTRTRRNTVIERGLREAGLAPQIANDLLRVRVLAPGSALISEVTAEEREPQLRIV